MFSRRTGWSRTPNVLARRLEALRAAGRPLVDLTGSSPARVGLHPPAEEVARAISDPTAAVHYAPDPRGLLSAREAIAARLSARGPSLSPGRLVLSASTSEAYAWLFKLLCDPFDEVLVPQPSYPLFEFLTDLEELRLRPYPLHFDGQWRFWRDELAALATERTRAVLVVNPGNPTGNYLERSDADALCALCAERGWALISDEVFADFPGDDLPHPERVRRAASPEAGCLTFSLSGLSKVAALPGLKLGWIAVEGPAAVRDEALARLELIADTYLSVNAPVQRAVPELLALAPEVQGRIRARVRANRARLLSRCGDEARWSVLPSEGGWSAILRVPASEPEEDLCLRLLEAGVGVHPGYFFDFPAGQHLVLSLLPEESAFAEGARIVAEVLAGEG